MGLSKDVILYRLSVTTQPSLSLSLGAQARVGRARSEVDPRTLGGRALPDAEPLFAFCVQCGRKAKIDRACAAAAVDA